MKINGFCAIVMAMSAHAAAMAQQPERKDMFEKALPADVAPLFSINLYDRALMMRMPAGLVPQSPQKTGGQYLIEWIPRGENFDNWTRMVTIRAFSGLGMSLHSTTAIARSIFYPASCTDGPIYRDDGEKPAGEGLTRSVISIGCAALPGQLYPGAITGAGEQDFIYLYRDARNVYTIHYAERGAPFSGKAPPLAIEKAAIFLQEKFGDIRLVPNQRPAMSPAP